MNSLKQHGRAGLAREIADDCHTVVQTALYMLDKLDSVFT